MLYVTCLGATGKQSSLGGIHFKKCWEPLTWNIFYVTHVLQSFIVIDFVYVMSIIVAIIITGVVTGAREVRSPQTVWGSREICAKHEILGVGSGVR